MIAQAQVIPLPDVVFAVLAGVGIAAACGLRAFLPLLALAVASHFGAVHLSAKADWLGSLPAITTLGVATLLELLADKVPVVDHALDVAATFVRPAAAAVAAWATFGTVNPALAFAAALILGGGALGIHLAKAKARLGSTILTLGHANPVISMVEDGIAAALSALAVLAPIAAALLVLGGIGLLANRVRAAR